MSDLELRKIGFDFRNVEFIWNPENPSFSIEMNKLSFFAIALEKYFCQAVRDAEPLITDPEVKEEARLFVAQEAIHAMAHRRHVKALIARYPGLQDTLDRIIGHFDTLYVSESLNYHLGYAGGLEGIFTPVFKLLLDNRDVLFMKGDPNVASLLLWHFCEEIEHRSSALMVYDHVVGDYWGRIRRFRGYMRHVDVGMKLLEAQFKKHVPEVPAEYYGRMSSIRLPLIDRLMSVYGVFQSQMPWHNPEHSRLPAYFDEWMSSYRRGDDMTDVVTPARKLAA